jgi:hypothetical protein
MRNRYTPDPAAAFHTLVTHNIESDDGKAQWRQDRLVALLEQPSDPALCNHLYLAHD